MSDQKQLLDNLTEAIAQAKAAAASLNIAAANAGSVQASTGAGGGTSNARTQSNTEQASGTESLFKSAHIDSDIGVPEAWSANVKRTYDLHQSDDFEAKMRNRIQFDAIISEQTKHLANLNQLTLQSLANNQNQSNLNNTLSIDRSWNINETDAFAVMLNKVVGDAVAKAVSK